MEQGLPNAVCMEVNGSLSSSTLKQLSYNKNWQVEGTWNRSTTRTAGPRNPEGVYILVVAEKWPSKIFSLNHHHLKYCSIWEFMTSKRNIFLDPDGNVLGTNLGLRAFEKYVKCCKFMDCIFILINIIHQHQQPHQ